MSENITAYMSTTEIPLPEINVEDDHDTPITISDNNVAKVNVSAEEHELEAYKKQYIKEKRKHVALKGFRKGNAPEEMVASLFKEEARQSARDNILFNKYMKLLQEHKLQPLSEPKVEHIHDKDGKMSASIVVDVLQPVVLGQYLGLEIEAMPVQSVEDGVKKTMAEIRQSYPKLITTDDAVNKGNVVITNFTITNGDKELEKQTNFKISIGSNLYYQEFEDQLVGMRTGENKEFDVQFPETYHKEDFRNKTIHFNLTVQEVKTITEYTNDELAKVLGYDGENKMIALLTKEVEAKYSDDQHLFYENQILGQLLTAHQFKIPNKLINDEIEKIHIERPQMPADEVEMVAERFIRTDLILHAIYERHPEIHHNQESFNAKIAELAVKANDSVENTIQKLRTAGKLQKYLDFLANCKVVDFLIEMADIKNPNETTVEVKKDGVVEITTKKEITMTITKTGEKENG